MRVRDAYIHIHVYGDDDMDDDMIRVVLDCEVELSSELPVFTLPLEA